MSLSSDRIEVDGVVTRLLDNLGLTITSKSAREGSEVRQQIGEVRANYSTQVKDGSFGDELLDVFNAIRATNPPLASLATVRQALFDETPTGDTAASIVQMAIGYCLAIESQVIVGMTFESRQDVEALLKVMTVAFETARVSAADVDNSTYYQKLTFLAGSLINYLANVARPMPQMVKFKMPTPLPALTLSNRVYYTAERWEELVKENKIIHPAFCPRELVGMSK